MNTFSSVYEEELVARVRAGDEAAFEAIFASYYEKLCDFVRSYVHSPEVAEDLVQNVFLRTWERRSSWAPANGVRVYFFVSCRHQALDYLKHERVVARAGHLAAHSHQPIGVGEQPLLPDHALEAAELAAVVRRAIYQLPERQRLVVLLRCHYQLSHAEIGHILGISAKGVETQFGRAMKSLRKRFAS
jgi:RNA polymerase sigma-70 factor (ECF subfamily)